MTRKIQRQIFVLWFFFFSPQSCQEERKYKFAWKRQRKENCQLAKGLRKKKKTRAGMEKDECTVGNRLLHMQLASLSCLDWGSVNAARKLQLESTKPYSQSAPDGRTKGLKVTKCEYWDRNTLANIKCNKCKLATISHNLVYTISYHSLLSHYFADCTDSRLCVILLNVSSDYCSSYWCHAYISLQTCLLSTEATILVLFCSLKSPIVIISEWTPMEKGCDVGAVVSVIWSNVPQNG